MAFNDEMAKLLMGEMDTILSNLASLTCKLDQVNSNISTTVNRLPSKIDASLSPVKEAIEKSTESANGIVAKFNLTGTAISERLAEQLGLVSTQIAQSVASLDAQRNPAPALLPYAVGIAATAIGAGIGFWFGSSITNTSWIVGSAAGMVVGVMIGGTVAIAGINRIEKKYGRDIDLETAAIKAYTVEIKAYTVAIKAELKAEIAALEKAKQYSHEQHTKLLFDFMNFEKKVSKQLDGQYRLK